MGIWLKSINENSCPKVSVIVLNWNKPDDTIVCVRSFEKLQYGNFELVVIDNGSTDDSVAIFERCLPTVTRIHTGRNLGYTGGNNVGIRFALSNGADYVLIVNNDTILINPSFVRTLIEELTQRCDVGIAGPAVLTGKDRLQATILRAPTSLNLVAGVFNHNRLCRRTDGIEHPCEAEAVSGCLLAHSK